MDFCINPCGKHCINIYLCCCSSES